METIQERSEYIKILSRREQYKAKYWYERDPIVKDRLLWRAQTFRHMVHLLPNQSILELGCADGLFSEQLHKVTRGENSITSATFDEKVPDLFMENRDIEFLSLYSLP